MSIILDPGHGGKDSGGGSNAKWLEKDIVLKISLYQYKRFKELGVEVSMTRYTDEYLSSQERTKIVRDSGAEICLSNHINSFNDKSVEGTELIHSIYSDGKLANYIMEKLVEAGAKKRRIFSRRHPDNSKLDYYYMHRETGKVQTVIIEYGFASNNNDTLRIQENWKEYAEAVVAGVCIYLNIPYSKEELKIEIVGKTVASLNQMQSWAKNNGASQKFIDAASIYYKYGLLTGIRADVLYCQSAKETNFGRYTGIVSEDMNNFAGIKIKNPVGDRKEDHESFSSVDDGIRAHFNHISAYVGKEPIGKPHDRYYVVKELNWAGTVKYVEELGGKWAPNNNYGKDIVNNYLNVLLDTEEQITDYKELYEKCKIECNSLKETNRLLEYKLNQIKDILKSDNSL